MDSITNAWEDFLRTGRVGDYLRYRQCMGDIDQDWVEGGEYPDENEHAGNGNRLAGY